MIGPVMIGPSSSHTGAVVRIGRCGRQLLGEPVKEAIVTFYNSFALTFEGHGSDRAVLGGLMDFKPDDSRIKEGRKLAEEAGIDFTFKAVPNASDLHPNAIRLQLTGAQQHVEVLGVSRGGGLISIREIDGFACNFNGQSDTLVITARDVSGSVAFLSSIIAHEECNIATMTVNRSARNDIAKLVLELDSTPRPLTVDYIRSVRWVHQVIYLPEPAEWDAAAAEKNEKG